MWYAKFNGALSSPEVSGSNQCNYSAPTKRALIVHARSNMLDTYASPHVKKAGVNGIKYTLYIKSAMSGRSRYAYDLYNLDNLDASEMDEDEYKELLSIKKFHEENM